MRAGRPVEPQHERLIERARARFSCRPGRRRLLVGGSIAHGYARPDSDVDVIVVVATEPARANLCERRLADYDGGYLDAKLVTRAFIEEVARRGSEPARWAFKDALVVFSRDPELPASSSAPRGFPEEARRRTAATFLRYLLIHVWFMGEADKRGDRYLAATRRNGFPCLPGARCSPTTGCSTRSTSGSCASSAQAPDRPDGLLEGDRPRPRAADEAECGARSRRSVTEFCGIDVSGQGVAEEFLELTEWAWRRDAAAPEDW